MENLFVGFGYENNPEAETCGFYVAFSRAKKRIVFSASGTRMNRFDELEEQSTKSIRPLYSLLKKAGLPFDKF